MSDWERTSKKLQAHGAPMSALGYCMIAYDAGTKDGMENAEKDFIKQQEDITDMCITSWVSTMGTLKEKVERLIKWKVKVALDPAVSSDARALINKGMERAATIADHHGNQCIGFVGDRAYTIAEAIREEINDPA